MNNNNNNHLFNALVIREDDGTYNILNVEGDEMIQCPHCHNVRPLKSFKSDDALQEWFNSCVRNPLYK
jgi:hypothetical protein